MKLIRDKTPDLLRGTTRKVRDKVEHEILLRSKLMEEAAEAAASTSDEELIMEMGDILEVMCCLLRLRDKALSEVFAAMNEKLNRKGGFEGGLVLEHDPLSNKKSITI